MTMHDKYREYLEKTQKPEVCPCKDGTGCNCCETTKMPAALIKIQDPQELAPFTHYLTPEENELIEEFATDLLGRADDVANDLYDHDQYADFVDEYADDEIIAMAFSRAMEKLMQDE